MKIRIQATLSIGYQSTRTIDVIEEVEDDMTEKEIESYVDRYVEEWGNNYIELGGTWSKLD